MFLLNDLYIQYDDVQVLRVFAKCFGFCKYLQDDFKYLKELSGNAACKHQVMGLILDNSSFRVFHLKKYLLCRWRGECVTSKSLRYLVTMGMDISILLMSTVVLVYLAT